MTIRPASFVLRDKRDLLPDPSWHTAMSRDPNSVTLAVGTAADGTWSFQPTPIDTTVETPAAATFLRAAGEAAAQIAIGLAAAINAAVASSSSTMNRFVRSAVAVGTDVNVTMRWPAPTFRLALDSPSSTMTAGPNDTFPIVRHVGPTYAPEERETKALWFVLVPLSSAGARIDVDTDATVDVRVLPVVELADGTFTAAGNIEPGAVRFGEPFSVPWSEGLVGVWIDEVTGTPPTGLGRIVVHAWPAAA